MANHLDVPLASGASTPHQAGLAAGTGILDLRVELAPADWSNGAFQAIISQDNNAVGQRFWWGITAAGAFEYDFYSLGGSWITTCVNPGFADGSSHGIRLVHNIGAGTVDFYKSTDFSSWTLIQTQTTGLSTSGMATAGTAPIVRVGTDIYAEPMVGKITKVQVLVAGSTILNWDATTATIGTGPWTATSGETWTRIGSSSVVRTGGGGGGAYQGSDLHILAASPAIDAANVATAQATDYTGTARGALRDIGAYEYGSGSQTTPPVTGDGGPHYGLPYNADALNNREIGSSINRRIGLRFRAPVSANLNSISMALAYGAGYSAGTGGSVKAALQADDGTASHFPSGTDLTSVTVSTPVGGSGTESMVTWTFGSPQAVTAGTLYHIVFTNADASPTVNWVSYDGTWSTTPTTPMQRVNPLLTTTTPDTNWFMNLKDGAGAWFADPSTTPSPVNLHFSDGTDFGWSVDYTPVVAALRNVGGVNRARMTFVSAVTRNFSGLRVRLYRQSGTTVALNVEIKNAAGTVLYSGTVAAASIVSKAAGSSPADGTWVGFDTPISLVAGTTYRIELSAPTETVFYQAYPIRTAIDANWSGVAKANRFSEGQWEYSTNSGGAWSLESSDPAYKMMAYLVPGAYYVSPSGSDSNPGTLAAPWQTITKAAATLTAGQTAYIRAGSYTEGGLENKVDWTASGTSTSPITIAGYPGEQVILYTQMKLSGNWLVLSDLVVDKNIGHSSYGSTDYGYVGDVNVWIAGADCVVTRCEVRNSNMSGFFFTGDRAKILANWIHHNGTKNVLDHGIYADAGTSSLIANNLIDSNYAFGIQVYPNCQSATFVHNTVIRNGNAGIIVGGDASTTSNNNIIDSNILAFNGEEGLRTNSSGIVSSGNLARKNILYGNNWTGNGAGNTWYPLGGLTETGSIVADPLFGTAAGVAQGQMMLTGVGS